MEISVSFLKSKYPNEKIKNTKIIIKITKRTGCALIKANNPVPEITSASITN